MGETVTIEHYNNADELSNLRMVEIGMKHIDAISDNNERYSIKSDTHQYDECIQWIE